MRDCPNAEMRDQLPEFVSGRLETRARAAIAAHLASCPDCAAEVALLESLSAALVAAHAARAPRVDAARIVAALPGRGQRRTSWFLRTQWRAAAAILVMAGASTLLWSNRSAPVTPIEATGIESMTFAGGVGDLSEAQLGSLLSEMDNISSTPIVDLDLAPLSPAAPGKGS